MNRADLLRRPHPGRRHPDGRATTGTALPPVPPAASGPDRGRSSGDPHVGPRRQVAGERRRQGRPAFWVTAGLTLAAAFGAAAFHVLLVQSEFRLARLEEQADAAERRYEQLRLEVARLSSPERIVRTAQERLGMVVPAEVSYLVAPVAVPGPPAGAGGDEAWSEVKPHLDAHR